MKINWGTGITIAMLMFMTFIGYIVYQTFQLNADLVQDDFYEQEVLFDGKKIRIENYKLAKEKITVEKQEEGIIFTFPNVFKQAKGIIQFYRPDDKSLDKEFDINLNESNIQILEYKLFREGKYEININFSVGEQAYLHQSSILF